MRKIIFVMLVLATGFWSCSQNDEKGGDLGYVDVTIGSKSGQLKSYVAPGGQTSWNVGDDVMVMAEDGDIQKFSYLEETPKSSALFKGMLKSGQGTQVYKAFHAPERSRTTLEEGNILVIERAAIVLDAKDEDYNSTVFGSYCPMVAIPIEFDANNADHSKNFQFYHMTTMIMGKLALRASDTELRSKVFDNIRFEVFALDGKKPFYTTVKLDMNQLTTTSKLEDLDEYIVNKKDKDGKIDHMITTMNFKDRENFTIDDLLREYNSQGGFPIPIIALPTDDCFKFDASISFYKGEELVVKFYRGGGNGSGLGPAGLNNLDFDFNHAVPEVTK